jgi:hypothetical protein
MRLGAAAAARWGPWLLKQLPACWGIAGPVADTRPGTSGPKSTLPQRRAARACDEGAAVPAHGDYTGTSVSPSPSLLPGALPTRPQGHVALSQSGPGTEPRWMGRRGLTLVPWRPG